MITSCWISPTGEIHPVRSHGHAEFAAERLGVSKLDHNTLILTLANQGWLHIGPAEFVSTIPFSRLPESQAAVLLQVMHDTSGMVAQNIVSYIHS